MEPIEQHRKTCKRFNDIGHAHALTFSCYRRRPFFTKHCFCEWMVESIAAARVKHGFHVWAYVIMPEHVHLLIFPTSREYSISKILSTLKQPVAKKALLFARQQTPASLPAMQDLQPTGRVHYRFWQRGGGFDRNLTNPHAIWNNIDYIHANPVRRCLCASPADWRWSSASEYMSPGSGVLQIDRESLPQTTLG